MLSIIFYIVFICFTLVYFVIFSVVFLLTVAFDRKRSILHHMSRAWAKCYFCLVPSWWVKVEGLENVDRNKSYVIIVNHRSVFDILLMYAVPLTFKWVSKKEVYKWPLFGWVLWMHGDITIDRGAATAVKKMIREGGEWLSDGVSVMMFPEGTRGKVDEVGRFREGAFAMAKNAGVGILPCVGIGTGTTMKGWRFNFKNKFGVKILPPVSPEEVQATDVKEMARKMQKLIHAEYEKTKDKTAGDKKHNTL